MAIEQVNLNLIRIFLEVPSSRSLTEIAKKTGYEAPTVSSNLISFEKQLGVKLFTRNPLKLTEVGEKVYEKLKAGYREIEYATNIACASDNLETGNLTIGCPSHIAGYFLSKIIKESITEYNNLKIDIDCESPCKLMLDKLKDNKLQFALLDFIPTEDELKDFEIEKIYESKYVFVSKKPIKIKNLEELNDYKYIMSDDDYKSSAVDFINYLKQFNVNINPQIKCKTTEIRINLCKLGLGIAYVIKGAVSEELSKRELYEVELPKQIVFPKSNINLVYKKDSLTGADEQFIDKYLRTSK